MNIVYVFCFSINTLNCENRCPIPMYQNLLEVMTNNFLTLIKFFDYFHIYILLHQHYEVCSACSNHRKLTSIKYKFTIYNHIQELSSHFSIYLYFPVSVSISIDLCLCLCLSLKHTHIQKTILHSHLYIL